VNIDELFTAPRSVDPLPEEVERSLIVRAQGGDETATETLLMTYAPALRSAVKRARSTTLSQEDARSVAILGLMEAIRQFDPERGSSLAPVLKHRLNDELTEAVAQDRGGSYVPSRMVRRFFGILRAAGGSVDAGAALAPSFGMGSDTFREVADAVRGVVSLDRLIEVQGDVFFLRASAIRVDRNLVDADDRMLCETAFAAVDDVETDVCRMAYGFTEPDPVPDAEVAHRLGMTRPTVQRRRVSALAKMRVALAVEA
jgi:RNA polymerase sigma factor (sigma-70 family)